MCVYVIKSEQWKITANHTNLPILEMFIFIFTCLYQALDEVCILYCSGNNCQFAVFAKHNSNLQIFFLIYALQPVSLLTKTSAFGRFTKK